MKLTAFQRQEAGYTEELHAMKRELTMRKRQTDDSQGIKEAPRASPNDVSTSGETDNSRSEQHLQSEQAQVQQLRWMTEHSELHEGMAAASQDPQLEQINESCWKKAAKLSAYVANNS